MKAPAKPKIPGLGRIPGLKNIKWSSQYSLYMLGILVFKYIIFKLEVDNNANSIINLWLKWKIVIKS